MRWLQLYVRSRRVALALGVATAAIALVWALWLAYTDSRTINVRLVALTVLIAVAAFGATLSGADDALDHTASMNWPVRRAGHLLLTATAITALLFLTTITDARFEPLTIVLRNTVGTLGLTALGAALLGAARSWIAPLAWTLIAVLPVMGPSRQLRIQLASWLIQPADTPAATACAIVLAVTGLFLYTTYGCPRRPAAQTAPDQ
jgi:hypothetical protein